MAQPYVGYGYSGYNYPPATGYDYSSYYQHDPNYAAWYAQQQAYANTAQAPTQQQQPAVASSVAPPAAPPAAPPLPSEEPPPLPQDDPDAAGTAAGEKPAAAAAAEGAKAAGGTGAQAQQPQITQATVDASGYANSSYYSAQYAPQYSQYGAYYPAAGGGYGASYAPTPAYAGYSTYGSYGPAATNSSYAPQVQQTNSSYPPHAAASGTTASAAPASSTDYSRMPPPASFTAAGANGQPSAIQSSSLFGNTAAPNGTAAGTAASSLSPQEQLSLAAMKAAAAAAAARVNAGSTAGSSQQPQYLSVGSFGASNTAAASAGTAAGAAAFQGSKPITANLPKSLTEYVHRALGVKGKTDAKRSELYSQLQKIIAKHREAGTIWSTDWDREPLPVLPSEQQSEQDRLAAAAASAAAAAAAIGQRGNVFDRLGGHGSADRGAHGSADRGDASWGSKRKKASDNRYRSSWQHDMYNRGSDSDDERNDSGDDDRRIDAARGSYTPGKNKRQRLEQQDGHGGRGQGKKQQQQGGGRGQGKKQQKQQRWRADEDEVRHAARGARFGAAAAAAAAGNMLAAYGWDDTDDAPASNAFIVGTCQKLEKRYLRLTRAPLPEEVRPQPVLHAALQRLLGLIQAKSEKYLYINDQFKAMRQDLTVQGIKNEFTVQVYEAHARAALEYGDSSEYNQCQTQLAILYAAGLPGSHAEFAAYRLLYQSVHAAHGEGRKLLGTLRQLLGNAVGQVAGSPEVQHAMQVRQALATANVVRFFRLYTSAPRLGRCLMDMAVKQLRWKGLNTLVRSHKPTALPLHFLSTTLGFAQPEQQQGGDAASAAAGQQDQLGGITVDEQGRLLPGCSEQRCVGEFAASADLQEGLAACLQWCKQHGAVFDNETDLSACSLLTKECWSKLFVPVDTSKVAHGDANLDIRDFLAAVL